MSEISISDNIRIIIGVNEDYNFILGDIVVVNFGIEDGILSGDKWWFL